MSWATGFLIVGVLCLVAWLVLELIGIAAGSDKRDFSERQWREIRRLADGG